MQTNCNIQIWTYQFRAPLIPSFLPPSRHPSNVFFSPMCPGNSGKPPCPAAASDRHFQPSTRSQDIQYSGILVTEDGKDLKPLISSVPWPYESPASGPSLQLSALTPVLQLRLQVFELYSTPKFISSVLHIAL